MIGAKHAGRCKFSTFGDIEKIICNHAGFIININGRLMRAHTPFIQAQVYITGMYFSAVDYIHLCCSLARSIGTANS